MGRGSLGPRRVAIVGAKHSGKTSTLLAVVTGLEGLGVQVGGVVQPARADGSGYDLREIGGRRRSRPFAIKSKSRNRGFDFDPTGWQWAGECLDEARRSADVVVVDELGRLEAGGGGHMVALSCRVDDTASVWLLGVREDVADAVEARMGAFACKLIPTLEPAHIEQYAREIIAQMGRP